MNFNFAGTFTASMRTKAY